ncbi:hypothetical protein NC661_14780 [Aquibacillus koreensis]|uniref:Uncharacterized protein n=1 Tax=Aquibacillus koreensis TaxID=279446 RepID=A0A9X3WQA5_9BACI|nr:hypothetical protein [Aquibacillus koreensis]MCT2537289.1 hypothetical protein [Aquibacillus koreensis]MDC3421636.1 hypothetical protein [Aquibacillus koreensis]
MNSSLIRKRRRAVADQNQTSIWKLRTSESHSESETGLYSDNKCERKSFIVRNRHGFGQQVRAKVIQSQKQAWIRTTSANESHSESEKGVNSDNKCERKSFIVRNRLVFGQQVRAKVIQSQKKAWPH